jgi:hypothetical protein
LNTEFLENPLVFATQYMILPFLDPLDGKDNKKITLTTLTFLACGRGVEVGGVAKKAVMLRPNDTGFPCYYLSSAYNKSKRCILGTDADYIFTATMEGNSFAFGSPTGSGEVLVGHTKATGIDDDESTMKIFGPNDYQGNTYVGVDENKIKTKGATVFGVRENNAWTFYAQRRVVTVQNQFISRGVIQLNLP